MPKNKGAGGKKKRRGKNISDKNNETILKYGDDQFYAKVTKKLGNERFELIVYYIDKNKDREGNLTEELNPKTKLGIMRGKMRKRMWVNISDIVLISTRDFEENKVDILHKYKLEEISKLKKYLGSDVNISEYEAQIDFENNNNNDDTNENNNDDDYFSRSLIPDIDSGSDNETLINDI